MPVEKSSRPLAFILATNFHSRMDKQEKKGLDAAAKTVQDALEKLLAGEPENALAKVLTIAVALVIGTPAILMAEPLLRRVFERINNKVGKDAVAAIAKEVETEAGFRRVAAEVGQHLEAALKILFDQQNARGGLSAGSMIETTRSSIADVVPQLAILLHRMEERLSGHAANGPDLRQPLAATMVLAGPTTTMRGLTSDRQEFEARAVRYGAVPQLIFDLTNMTNIDVRIVDVYVDVLEILDIEIVEIWSWYGMIRPVRKYAAVLEPRKGRYRCQQNSADGGYLAVSPGELELFHVELQLHPSEGLYRVRLSVACSAGGENFIQEFERVSAFGVYDPDVHVVINDNRAMLGPPGNDGGDIVRTR